MSELLEPEAHGAEPLLLRRRAGGDLEPVLDLEIGEVRLDHAEHGAAVLLRGHRAAQADDRLDARGRPDISERLGVALLGGRIGRQRAGDGGEPRATPAWRESLDWPLKPARAAKRCDQRKRADEAKRRAASTRIRRVNSERHRRGTTWLGRFSFSKPLDTPVLPQRPVKRQAAPIVVALGRSARAAARCPDISKDRAVLSLDGLSSHVGREDRTIGHRRAHVPVGSDP